MKFKCVCGNNKFNIDSGKNVILCPKCGNVYSARTGEGVEIKKIEYKTIKFEEVKSNER